MTALVRYTSVRSQLTQYDTMALWRNGNASVS
jgi:uncharacterized membrane protein YjfL (UPF0719 family)